MSSVLGAQGLPGSAKTGGDADISGGITRGEGAVIAESTWGIRSVVGESSVALRESHRCCFLWRGIGR